MLQSSFDLLKAVSFFTLGVWIVLSAVLVQTSGRWSSERASLNAIQNKALSAFDDEEAETKREMSEYSAGQLSSEDAKKVQNQMDATLRKIEAIAPAIDFDNSARGEFKCELGFWVALTALGSLLLALKQKTAP
jgi:hypothetical protein